MTGAPSASTADPRADDPPDTAEAGSERPDREAPDADAALARIRERAGELRDHEVETALAKLDARGELSAADREAVERLADRLVTRLLAAPERSLRAAADADAESDGREGPDSGGRHDPETVETALALFGE